MVFTAQQIAAYIDGEIIGNPEASVNTFAKIEEGKPGAISFLANPKYEHYLYSTKSTIVLVNKDFELSQPVRATLIKTENAYESVARLLTLYESMQSRKTGVSEKAYIAPSAKIGEDCYIAPFAYIGDNVTVGNGTSIYPNAVVCDNATIGENCIIYPNVTIYHDCRIGNRVILHAGAVIGADGFGFAPSHDGYEKIPQIGIAVIEDDVEIGANTCVDRSTMGATYVRKGVKLDNLVQIAHNVEVGKHTVMSAQVGVAGSAHIGEWCMLGGQVGIAGHIKIGDHTNCGAQSGVPGNVAGNCTLMGYPAIDHKNFARSSVVYKKLPEIYRQINEMQKEIEELRAKIKQ